MKDLKYITDDECSSAIAEVEKGLNFKNGDVTAVTDGVYSYHSDALITEITNDGKKRNIICQIHFVNNYISMSGLTIHSTQDSKIQKRNRKKNVKKKKIYFKITKWN